VSDVSCPNNLVICALTLTEYWTRDTGAWIIVSVFVGCHHVMQFQCHSDEVRFQEFHVSNTVDLLIPRASFELLWFIEEFALIVALICVTFTVWYFGIKMCVNYKNFYRLWNQFLILSTVWPKNACVSASRIEHGPQLSLNEKVRIWTNILFFFYWLRLGILDVDSHLSGVL